MIASEVLTPTLSSTRLAEAFSLGSTRAVMYPLLLMSMHLLDAFQCITSVIHFKLSCQRGIIPYARR